MALSLLRAAACCYYIRLKKMNAMCVDDLLEKPYVVVDFIPQQVPEDSDGQYFNVENFFLRRPSYFSTKFLDLLLKLNCYYSLETSTDGECWTLNPDPATLERSVCACLARGTFETSMLYVCFLNRTVLVVLERDCSSLAVYNPTPDFVDLLRKLATSVGLFVWQH